MTISETAQDAMMESVHRPMPALAPRPFWFLVGVAFLLPPPPRPRDRNRHSHDHPER